MNNLILAIALTLVSTAAFSEKSYTVEQLEEMIANSNKPTIAKDDFPTCKSGLIEWLDGVEAYPITVEKDIDGKKNIQPLFRLSLKPL
ncbi:hypothetical protein MASR2M36_14980 [Providencia sp.]